MRQEIARQQVLKEFLREVLRIRAAVTIAQDKSIQRRPVSPTELLEGFIGLRGTASLCPEHHAPMSGGEPVRLGLVLICRAISGRQLLFLHDHTGLWSKNLPAPHKKAEPEDERSKSP